jgi:hypothetical protein
MLVSVCVLLAGTEKTLMGTLASIIAQLLAVLVIILIGEPVREMAISGFCPHWSGVVGPNHHSLSHFYHHSS